MTCTCNRVNVREDTRAMRQAKGQHTVSAAEYAALVGTGTASLRTAHEAPDGYAIALDKQRRATPPANTPPDGTPPDGYAIALAKQRPPVSTSPTPTNEAPDGYAIALDTQRKEK